jgi:hypothetical protein
MSPFSTNMRSMNQIIMDALHSTTESFLPCAYTITHYSVSRFSIHVTSVGQILNDTFLSTTESFSALTRACRKPHTSPDTGCITILEISYLNVHWRTLASCPPTSTSSHIPAPLYSMTTAVRSFLNSLALNPQFCGKRFLHGSISLGTRFVGWWVRWQGNTGRYT